MQLSYSEAWQGSQALLPIHVSREDFTLSNFSVTLHFLILTDGRPQNAVPVWTGNRKKNEGGIVP